jgi:hypothetical protein
MQKRTHFLTHVPSFPASRLPVNIYGWETKSINGILKSSFLIALLLLSGCSSLLEEQPKGPWAMLKKDTRQCLMDLKSDSELKSIANKVTLESHYDRDAYFELLNIEDFPTSAEKKVIKKWELKLERCFKIKAESYTYEPVKVAMWSAASDSEQLSLVLELAKGSLKYGEFAAKRLEIDTRYRGLIMRAISADYKRPIDTTQPKSTASPKTPASPNSSCGWEGNQWICRSL